MADVDKHGRWGWRWGVAALVILVVLVLLPAASVSVAEERNSFCTSCHLKPEQTYYDRALVKARQDAADLATADAQAGLTCVSCHRGDQGPRDRVIALALGAGNTAKFALGQYDPNHSQVAVRFLLDDSCRRCHVAHPELGGIRLGEVNRVVMGGFDNHFHTTLFDPQLKTSVTCTDCHSAHREAFPELQFLDQTKVVLPACERCHQELGRGPAKGLR
jgi:hypothetical protein